MTGAKIIWLVLAAVFLKQLAWVTFMPLWQTPDEQAHFSQVQNLAESAAFSPFPVNLSREIWTSEIILGTNRDEFGNNKFTYHPEFNVAYSDKIMGPEERLISDQPKSYRTDFVKNEGTWYPPAYYLLASKAYQLMNDGSLFDRAFAVRMLSVVMMVGLAYVSYLIGKQLFNNELWAIGLALLVSFHPMVSFVFAGVTSDIFFILVFSLFIWRCLVLFKAGLNIKDLFWIALIVIVAFWTKPQANIMAFILVPLLGTLVVFKKKRNIKLILPSLLIIGISLVGIFLRVRSGVSIFPETEYIESLDFSLPRLGEHLQFTFNHTYREVLPWYWGVFRWLSLGLPEEVRRVTNVLTIVSVWGFISYVTVKFVTKKYDRKFWMVVFCAFAGVVYFAAITMFDFGFRQAHGYSFGIQGRYFFPVIITQMTVFLLGLVFFLPERFKGWGNVALVIAMITLNIVVFFWVAGSYYQFSWPTFLIQASQYKPFWLKFPVNLIVLILYLWSCLGMAYSLCRRNPVSR